MKHRFAALWILMVSAMALPHRMQAQLTDAEANAAVLSTDYTAVPNIVYLKANNYDNKLDVYQPAGDEPHPTLVYFHGGGWVRFTKEEYLPRILPFLLKGWAVVNVEYRPGVVSLAPAAVEDCRCALHWVFDHAKDYKFDTNRIVLMGHSAGGHLSLTTGMLPVSAGLDRECDGREEMNVAAIVDWYGITDVDDLYEGAHREDYASKWMGSMTDRDEIGKRASPLTYVRPGLPPILMIQGDADTRVPYSHSVRLHEALDKVGVSNELLTVPGGNHGGFTHDQMITAYTHIWAFIKKFVPNLN